MSYGQGNIQVTNLQKGGGGGGVETLDNGLTLTGTNGQLGGTLIKDTEIDLEGFDFFLVGEGTETIDFDNAEIFNVQLTDSLSFSVGSGSNNSSLDMSPTEISISNSNATSNGLFNYSGNSWVWSVDDTATKLSQIEMDLTGIYSTVSNAALSSTIFQTSSEIQFIASGSIQGNIPVGSPSSYIEFSSGVPTSAGYILGMRLTNDKFDIQDLNNVGSKRYLDIDRVNKNFILGDVDNFGNGTKVSVSDGVQKIYLLANDGINTTAPSVNGQGSWQLGKVLAGAVALDAAHYIEVNIDGVVKKILVAS